MAELYARPGADAVTCRECGITHNVADRRDHLMAQAKPLIVNVKQASQYLGWFGDVVVNQKTIGTWCTREQLPVYLGVGRRIRIGDLLDLIADKAEKKTRQDV